MEEKVVMPKLGLTMTRGTVVKWHKAVGDAVAKGDIVCVTLKRKRLLTRFLRLATGISVKSLYKRVRSRRCCSLFVLLNADRSLEEWI